MSIRALTKKFKPLGGKLEEVSFLIVDDESLMQVMVRQMLRDNGALNMRFADSGIEAFHMLKAQPSQVVITDWHMPRMTGAELLQAIKNDPELFTIQVLLISSERSPLWVLHAFEEGVDGFLVKPFNPKDLLQAVLKLLDKGASAGKRRVDEVIRLKLMGHFQEAIELGEQLLGEEGEGEVSMALADCHYRTGQLDKALERAEAAMEKNPDSKTMSLMGKIHMEKGNFEEAVAILQQAVDKNSLNFTSRMELATALIKGDRIEDGRKLLDAAAEEKLTDMNLVELAKCYLLCTDVERAAALLNQSRDPLPQTAPIFNACGAALWKRGSREEGLKLYKKCIKISPDYSNAHYNLGLAYCLMGSYVEAKTALESAIRLKPDLKAAKELLDYVKQKQPTSVQ